MTNEFIKKQQELAQPYIAGLDQRGRRWIEDKDLDTLITQIITNTGEELMRLAEGESRKHNCPPDDGTDYDHGAWVAIDTLKEHITNVTGVE